MCESLANQFLDREDWIFAQSAYFFNTINKIARIIHSHPLYVEVITLISDFLDVN